MKEFILKVFKKNRLIAKIGAWFYYYYICLFKKQRYENLKQYSNDKRVLKDMIYSVLQYGTTYTEYNLYNFRILNHYGRKNFVSDSEKKKRISEITLDSDRGVLIDKYECYKKYRKYFKRDLIKIENEEIEEFLDFCNKHKNIFVKPYNGSLGEGTIKITENDDYKLVYNKIKEKGGTYVLEELIKQSDILGSFHSQSINTVRFATVNDGEKIHNLFAFLRIGCGDSIVDNLAAGGMSAAIDLDTGIIISYGKNEKCEVFLKHPDTQVQIIGFQLPDWDEVLRIINEMAQLLPECKYISWDLAHTEKGWVLVEANSTGVFDGIQMHGIGLRDKFEKYFK